MHKYLLLLVCIGLSTLAAKTMSDYEKLLPGEKVAAKAVVYYSEPILFDYDKNGKKNNVVMAAKLFIKRTKKGYEGYLVRGLYDTIAKKAIAYYENALIMHPPRNTYIAVSDIQFEGRTVRFRSGPFLYIFKDGGEGILNDEVVVKLKQTTKSLRLYGGDIQVFNTAHGRLF